MSETYLNATAATLTLVFVLGFPVVLGWALTALISRVERLPMTRWRRIRRHLVVAVIVTIVIPVETIVVLMVLYMGSEFVRA